MLAAETYVELLKDPAHWMFELTTGLVFDVFIGILIVKVVWPRIRHHVHRDVRHAAGHPAPDDPAHVAVRTGDLAPAAADRPTPPLSDPLAERVDQALRKARGPHGRL